MFLGTLGSWSVTVYWLRITAFVMTLCFFLWRLNKKAPNKMLFSNIVVELEQMIAKEIKDEDKRKALLYDLTIIKNKHLSVKSVVKNIVYWACLFFWLVSIYYAYST